MLQLTKDFFSNSLHVAAYNTRVPVLPFNFHPEHDKLYKAIIFRSLDEQEHLAKFLINYEETW